MRAIRTVTLNPAFDLHYGMEHFEARRENYVTSVLCDAGGKGVNISRALTVNGIENIAYVVLGEENGASFEARLRADGMCYRPIYVPGRIRENMTLHPTDDRETRISLDTFCVPDSVPGLLEEQLLADVTAGDLVAFAGRIPRGLEKSCVLDLLRRLIKAGVHVVVDSNSFTPRDLQSIRPWFIKPNEQEIAAFWDRPIRDARDAADAAAQLVREGVAEEVMISLGGDGAVWSDGRRRLQLSVPRLEHPRSTIGAGDSTLAGMLGAAARGESVELRLRTAVAYGTAACMTEGTLPPQPADIRRVAEQVTVKEL